MSLAVHSFSRTIPDYERRMNVIQKFALANLEAPQAHLSLIPLEDDTKGFSVGKNFKKELTAERKGV